MVADGPQRDFKKCNKVLLREVKERVEMVAPASLARRFCAVLGLGLGGSARRDKGAAMRHSR